MKRIYYAPVPEIRCGDDLEHTWRYTVPVYRAAPHVWQVGGQDDVCAYLLDSGDGLILIDTGYRESLYLLVDRIWQSGHRPGDIRKILLSHWHWDHVNGCAGLAEMSGAEIWISEEDEKQHQKHKNDTEPMSMADYSVTNLYGKDEKIKLGRFTITVKPTPGHTPGAVSFFFEDSDDETGEKYNCAMHGGLGLNTMKPEALEREGLPESLAYRFGEDCRKLAEQKVDIVLPSHLNQGNVLENIPEDREDYRVWITDYAWKDIMLSRAEAIEEMYSAVRKMDDKIGLNLFLFDEKTDEMQYYRQKCKNMK